MTDAFGTPINGVTVTASSGTQYPLSVAAAVPEPGSLIILSAAVMLGGRGWRRRVTGRA